MRVMVFRKRLKRLLLKGEQKMKPNLFEFGTSELTHDAILAWCLEWGNHQDETLYNLSKEFIELLTDQSIVVKEVEIVQQRHHIDVLAIVNNEFLIVIEDKLDTGAREGQLDRYKEAVEKEYPSKKKFYAYVTVGDEASYDYITDKNYKVIERRNLLALIEKYKDENHILADYYDYLSKIEKDFISYKKNQDLNSWSWRAWQGFFKGKLYPRFKNKGPGWSYVSNERGGFQAFYWGFEEGEYEDDILYTSYLQIEAIPGNIENSIIAFKVEVEDEAYRSQIRNHLWEKLENMIGDDSIIKRPKRFGKGRTMTYGEIKDFKTKAELYDAIREAETNHRKLGIHFKDFYFDFDVEPPVLGEDMILINVKVPDNEIGNSIILITCGKEDEDKLKEFIKREKGMIFVFEDELSMEHFRRLFLGSKFYLDEGFNLADLQYIGQSKENNIKYLKYILGIESFIDKEKVLSFLNESKLIEVLKQMETYNVENIWVLKDQEDNIDIEGFYII